MQKCACFLDTEAAGNAMPVHACDWIASQMYWISIALLVGRGGESGVAFAPRGRWAVR